MTRREILAKHEIILVKDPKWLDAELTEDEAEAFEEHCILLQQIFEEEFQDDREE